MNEGRLLVFQLIYVDATHSSVSGSGIMIIGLDAGLMFCITQVKLLREYYMLKHYCLCYREEMCNKLTYSLYCAQLDKLSTQDGRAL